MQKILSIWEFLKGKKTYFISGISIAYAIIVIGLHQNDWQQASELILQSLGLSALRHSVNK